MPNPHGKRKVLNSFYQHLLIFLFALSFCVVQKKEISLALAFEAPRPHLCLRVPSFLTSYDQKGAQTEVVENQIESVDEDGGDFKQLQIAFVTGNEMKKREMSMILAEHGATKGPDPKTSLVNLRMLDVDLPEIQEMNTEAIAKHKAIQGAQLAGGPCVIEDTSLQFHALGGMPGPFIKWFQSSLKSEGLYKILQGYEDKSASAVCTLAFCPYPHADPVVFTGVVEGTIVEPVLGRGFGWDSIFLAKGETIPFSCMSTTQKNVVSHRGGAVRKWADWLGKNQEELWERQEGKPAVGHKGLNFKQTD